jgi:hypothetical protein
MVLKQFLECAFIKALYISLSISWLAVKFSLVLTPGCHCLVQLTASAMHGSIEILTDIIYELLMLTPRIVFLQFFPLILTR